MTVKGRGEVLRLAEDLGLELLFYGVDKGKAGPVLTTAAALNFANSTGHWREALVGGVKALAVWGEGAGPLFVLAPDGLEGRGVSVHDPRDLEVAPGVLTSEPPNFASYPGN